MRDRFEGAMTEGRELLTKRQHRWEIPDRVMRPQSEMGESYCLSGLFSRPRSPDAVCRVLWLPYAWCWWWLPGGRVLGCCRSCRAGSGEWGELRFQGQDHVS